MVRRVFPAEVGRACHQRGLGERRAQEPASGKAAANPRERLHAERLCRWSWNVRFAAVAEVTTAGRRLARYSAASLAVAAQSSRARSADLASATARTIGSVLLARTSNQLSGQSSRNPSRLLGVASAK
jgi:hypothetical protein